MKQNITNSVHEFKLCDILIRRDVDVPPLRPYLAYRLAFLSFFHLPLKIESLITAGDGTHGLPESVKLYQIKAEDHIHLVKLSARC